MAAPHPLCPKGGTLFAAYLHRGFWKGVDNAKDLSEAEEFLAGSAA